MFVQPPVYVRPLTALAALPAEVRPILIVASVAKLTTLNCVCDAPFEAASWANCAMNSVAKFFVCVLNRGQLFAQSQWSFSCFRRDLVL